MANILRPVPLCILLALPLLAASARAAENPYDVVGRTLAPFFDPFLQQPKTGNHAIDMRLTLRLGKDRPQDGASGRLAVERPGRLRLEGTLAGERAVVCYSGERAWAWPRSVVEPIVAGVRHGKASKAPPPGPWTLPVPDAQVVFLPALLRVRDAGYAEVGDRSCRVLDLGLMPELASSPDLQRWMARLWIGEKYRPARVRVQGPDWGGVIDFEALEFLPSLPPETWVPTEAEEAEVLELDAARYWALIRSALGKD